MVQCLCALGAEWAVDEARWKSERMAALIRHGFAGPHTKNVIYMY